MGRAAEEVGFDSIWVGDHLLYRGDGRPERAPWDAWTLLAGLAGQTERVALGPLVACTAFQRPGVLARTAAAVDELSGGWLVLALGAGWNETEFRAFGIPFENRVARFAEAFEIVRRLLAGERVTFAGAYETVADAVLLPPPGRRPPHGTATRPRAWRRRTAPSTRRPGGPGATRPRSHAAPARSSCSIAPPASARSQTASRRSRAPRS
jgi:alkanesulfonate monooxygenase SsuD/methylene tetrahydromethanopterin reductase-like flavin-dependent oxidoreductase (luciferase family)